VVNGTGFPEHFQGRKKLPIPFIKVSDMNSLGAEIVVSTAASTVDRAMLKEIGAKTCPPGTVIFPKVGGALLTNKKRLLGTEAAFDNNVMGIVPLGLDEEWLLYWFQTIDLRQLANTQAMPSIRQSDIAALELRLPPLAEQRRIAGRLREQMAEVARARAAVQAQLAAAQALPAAVLRAHFTTPAALRWPRRRLGEVVRVQTGYAFKSDWFTNEGIRLLRNVNVAQGRTTWEDSVCLPAERRSEFPDFELNAGDIILSLDRPLVSGGLKLTRLTANDVPALLLQRVGRFVIKQGVEADYLFRFLQTDGFIRTITAHEQSLGVPHVSPKQIEEVELPLPPLPEQRALAARLTAELSAATALRESLAQRLAAIERLPAALLRTAFAGAAVPSSAGK
jgi:type I restriction enzyme S subunit